MVNTKKIKAMVLSGMLGCMQLSLAPDQAQVLEKRQERSVFQIVNEEVKKDLKREAKIASERRANQHWYERDESSLMIGMYAGCLAVRLALPFTTMAGISLAAGAYFLAEHCTIKYNESKEVDPQKLEKELKNLKKKMETMDESIKRHKAFEETIVEEGDETDIEGFLEYVNISPISPREA